MRRREFLVRFGSLLAVAPIASACASPSVASLTSLSVAGALQQGAASEVRLPSIEPPTLDPGLAEDSASIDIITQMFDGLVAFDAYGGVSGVGAESWTVSADGLTYTFK